MLNKTSLRNFIGELPLAAELDYVLRQKNRARKDHYNLSRLQKSLPQAVAQAKPFIERAAPGKNILFFATLHYWIEQAAFFSLTLAGLGHKVTLLTLPYSEWHKEMDKLTQKQRVLHTRDALSITFSFCRPYSLLGLKPAAVLPAASQSGCGRGFPLGRAIHADARRSGHGLGERPCPLRSADQTQHLRRACLLSNGCRLTNQMSSLFPMA